MFDILRIISSQQSGGLLRSDIDRWVMQVKCVDSLGRYEALCCLMRWQEEETTAAWAFDPGISSGLIIASSSSRSPSDWIHVTVWWVDMQATSISAPAYHDWFMHDALSATRRGELIGTYQARLTSTVKVLSSLFSLSIFGFYRKWNATRENPTKTVDRHGIKR